MSESFFNPSCELAKQLASHRDFIFLSRTGGVPDVYADPRDAGLYRCFLVNANTCMTSYIGGLKLGAAIMEYLTRE